MRDVVRAVVSGSPSAVTVRAGSPSAAGSVLTGSGVAGAVSGTPADITLSVGDRFGNAVTTSGSVPTVTFTPPAVPGATVALTPSVGFTDNGDGTFSLRYTVSVGSSTTTVATTAVVAVTLAGALVTSGCETAGAGGVGCAVTVAPASAAATLVMDPAKTTADGAGFFHGEAGREMVFYAYPRDASGVPINTPGLDIVLELSGPSGSPFFALTQRAFIHDASLGRYVMKSSAVTSAGEYDVKVTAGGVSIAPPPAGSAWPVVVFVRPGPTSRTVSTYALTAGMDVGGAAAAGVPAEITFYPKDEYNNSQTYGAWRDVDVVTAEVSPGPLASPVVFRPSSLVGGGGGGGGTVLSARVTVNVAASHALSVAVNGERVTGVLGAGGASAPPPTYFPVLPSAVEPEGSNAAGPGLIRAVAGTPTTVRWWYVQVLMKIRLNTWLEWQKPGFNVF